MVDLIWLESPWNALLTVADLDAICAVPRKRGAILNVGIEAVEDLWVDLDRALRSVPGA